MASWDEVALPLAKPTRERIAKRVKNLTTDGYIIYVTNPRKRPLPALLEENGYESVEGDDVIALLQELGYEAEIVLDGE